MMADDKTLITRILGGETEAFRHLMRRHGGTLLAFIESVVGSREEAEDVVQEAFLFAYRSLHQYDCRVASFATWLHRIAYHEALRRMKRRRLPTLSWDADDSLLKYAEEADSDDWLTDASEEQQERLDEAIRRLPDYDQTLLRLYYEDDLPLKEIAYILDSKAGILASRLHRIRDRLRKELQKTKYR
ncbi:MAG: sigma-70 family RNA polymerase sigma factor [Bacteroidaceae bacterium]|nr:sigma-70 family RNA polymerase sigma factor [Bacteroidaceae bacterium]